MLYDCKYYTQNPQDKPVTIRIFRDTSSIPTQVSQKYNLDNAGNVAIHFDGDELCVYMHVGARLDYDLGGLLVQSLKSNLSQKVLTDTIFGIDCEDKLVLRALAIGWGLSQYSFNAHKSAEHINPVVRLSIEENDLFTEATAIVGGLCLVKNMINTPPNYMYPEALTLVAKDVAQKFDASIRVYSPNEVKEEFPLVYGVGKASDNLPYLADMTWGDPKHPMITLVGKGVTFDTGGLDIKPVIPMQLMKKDMGGAAHVLGLGYMIMALKLPVRLRIITPTAENSISSNAMRPSDVLDSRHGKTVEIGNTDAEGRLLLADGITLATETEKPDLLVDMGTLTGGHSMGVEISAMMSNNDEIAQQLQKIGFSIDDKVWQLPLWDGYLKELSSSVADICNNGTGRAGAIHVGLFLQEFLKQKVDWVHLDIFGWEAKGRPARAVGGADYGIQALLQLIRERYC